MTTLAQEIERPRFLDEQPRDRLRASRGLDRTVGLVPAPEQLALGRVAAPARRPAPGREGESTRDSLFERLQAERAAEHGRTQAGPTRGGEATLDELLVGAWEGLSARRPVACPICAGAMHPRPSVTGGACEDCGSQVR